MVYKDDEDEDYTQFYIFTATSIDEAMAFDSVDSEGKASRSIPTKCITAQKLIVLRVLKFWIDATITEGASLQSGAPPSFVTSFRSAARNHDYDDPFPTSAGAFIAAILRSSDSINKNSCNYQLSLKITAIHHT